MVWGKGEIALNLDEAVALSLEALRKGWGRQYGYDLYAPEVARHAAQMGRSGNQDSLARQWSPIFLTRPGRSAAAASSGPESE